VPIIVQVYWAGDTPIIQDNKKNWFQRLFSWL
jgi:hypothetical protein